MGLIQLHLNTLPAPTGKKAEFSPLDAPFNMASVGSMLVGVRSASGKIITPATALRASAVLACIRILCEDLSALPLNFFKRTPQGAVLATEDPRYLLLHDAPNPWMTSMELRESLILDVLLYGQAFVEKAITRDGITALLPLSAGRMFPMNPLDLYIPPPVPLFWRYADPRRGERVVMSDDLWTVKMLAPAGYLEGQSLILLAREAIGLALAAEEQGGRLFKQGVQTDLVLEAGEGADAMDKESKDQLRKAFMDRHAGTSNAFMPLLLEGGMTAKRIGLTAQESQYVETRQFQLADISRIFRIPEVLLGISQGKSATYASAEQFFLAYVKHTLQPWCQRIEQSIHRDLLAPSEAADYFAKHDLDSLTRADLQTRYAAHAAGIQAGFLTRNEARAMESLPLLPDLDTPLQLMNMGSGDNLKPAQGAGARLAHQLAKNCVSHESKLLADGKPAADVYGKLLPSYLASKTGLSAVRCTEYCQARLEQPDADSVELLEELLQRV